MSKSKVPVTGIVYSTDPNYKPVYEEPQVPGTLDPASQKLKLRLDNRHRGGKAVTLVEGFVGTPDDLEILGKKLKAHCGTGGSVKNGEVLVQGDNREKIFQWLSRNGYKLTKKL